MNETPRLRLRQLLSEFLAGHLGAGVFCAEFEHIYNLELDKSTLSPRESEALSRLFEEVIWYSPLPAERAQIPNYRSEEDIELAAKAAAQNLDLEPIPKMP